LSVFKNWIRSRRRFKDWDQHPEFTFKYQSVDTSLALNNDVRKKAGLAPHPF
jgi:hypothetical protein